MKYRSSKRSKATDIPITVKQSVLLRDEGRCVYCGAMKHVAPNAHIVPRSQGGMGIETNIVTLCTNFGNKCHYYYDFGTKEQMEMIDEKIIAYMKSKYGESWCKEDQIYKKYED